MYNFKQKSKFVAPANLIELRRMIPIKSLSGVTKNITANSKEYVVHVQNEPDYRLTCD